MSINIVQEYKDQIKRVEIERDIYRALLVDEVQFNRNISRDEAEMKVSQEVFSRGGRV